MTCTSKNISFQVPFGYLTFAMLSSAAGCYCSRFVLHPTAKITICSGFGTVISCCFKEISVVVLGTLDGFYPTLIDLLVLSGVLLISLLSQMTISSILLEKYQACQVYSGYFLTNLLFCFLASQLVFEEVLNNFELGYFTLVVSVIGALIMTLENTLESSKLIQEI